MFLYIVATPIGNLEDITLRALRILKEVDYILCEDTRVTKKLLAHYNIDKPLISYHQHSSMKKVSSILGLLEDKNNLALVSDAGTPGISDPGGKLIEEIFASALASEVTVVPIPGASAVTALASIAGVPMDKFLFLGFPPHKKGRKKFFAQIVESSHSVLFYESSHRILKSLKQLQEAIEGFTESENYYIIVGRELTKKFEQVYRGPIDKVSQEVTSGTIKGEFVIAVSKSKKKNEK